MTLKSNFHNRQFLYESEVPAKVLEYYDWLSDDEKSDYWIKYHNEYYHITDFSVASGNLQLWDAYYNHTVWSGIVIKLSDDNETYQIGYYYY